MQKSIKIVSNAVTHVGNVRKVNQDAYLSQPSIGLWIVADGMGGHHNGEYASQLLTEEIHLPDDISDFDSLVAYIRLIISQKNYQLYEYAKSIGEDIRCGSTIVVLIVRGNQAAVIWVGDSRIYKYNFDDLNFAQITIDHSVYNEMLRNKEIDKYHPMAEKYSKMLARVVGGAETVEIDEQRFLLKDHERFLLCSDGLFKELSDDEIYETISQKYSPGKICKSLLAQSIDKAGIDNITAMVVDISIV